jgi:hypothetical protein
VSVICSLDLDAVCSSPPSLVLEGYVDLPSADSSCHRRAHVHYEPTVETRGFDVPDVPTSEY